MRRASKYGNIGIFEEVVGGGMCETAEHTGVGELIQVPNLMFLGFSS